LKQLLTLIALIISCSAFGQDENRLTDRLNTFLSVDQSSLHSALTVDGFLKKLEKKQSNFKQESDFVRYLFTKTHQQYLKQYEAYSPITDLFNKGSYNCLTGTILYALLLDQFHIHHQVIETNYHIFILAETKQGQILLEATDPVNGFVSNPQDIESRINTYKENLTQASSSKKHYYQFNFELFNPVSIKELRGLLYYNKAVDAYNHKNLNESVQFLKKAHALYSSTRIDEFSQILLLTIQQSKLDNRLRTEYINTILTIKRDLMPIVATLN
jgi:hypothetical protein